MMRRLGSVVVLASVLWLSPHAVSAQPEPAERYTPLVHGWESFFRITSEPMQRRGRPWLAGYVTNDYGFTATHVRIVVDGLDGAGRVVAQRVSWLGSTVPPGARVYYEVPAPGPAASYRVSVFAFEWLQTASIQAP